MKASSRRPYVRRDTPIEVSSEIETANTDGGDRTLNAASIDRCLPLDAIMS